VQALTTAADGDRLKTGAWGGEHVALTVTDAGAHVELDCAYGDISEPVTIDRDGRMAVRGVYVFQAGPERENPNRKPARFSGTLSGEVLTFEVRLIESGEIVGTFKVAYGAPPRGVRKCR
jgi:hypothetical protein